MKRWTLRDRLRYGWTDPATILDTPYNINTPIGPQWLKRRVMQLLIIAVFAMVAWPVFAQSYCLPKDGKDRIQKTGPTCPSGYRSSGRDCCEALRANEPKAFPKIEGKACPSGTFASGNFCKEFR